MSTQQLIYESAVPVSSGRHAGCSVEVGGDYAFASHVNSLPLMAVEFPPASSEYSIIFAGDEQAVMPAVILGLRARENLFIGSDHAWSAKYVPAFARRYPFVFSGTEGSDTFTLCIDEAFKGFNREGRGAALFDAEGKPTAYVQNVLTFLQEYQAQFQRTRQFCQRLKEHGLLDPMQAQITTKSGEKLSLSGFLTVNRDRLKALPDAVLAALVKSDEMELIHLHLHSMRNFGTLLERMESEAQAMSEAAPTPV
jgi:hypothetical protein